jgi:hypothetical protein
MHVLVVDPTPALQALLAGRPELLVQTASPEGALESLLTGGHDLLLWPFEAGPAPVLKEVPVVMWGSGDHATAALGAGAAWYLDTARARPDDVVQALAFVEANRAAADLRRTEGLREIASYLAHEGKNVLAAVGGAVQVIGDRMPLEAVQDRAVCAEIGRRLRAYGVNLDGLVARLRTGEGPPARADASARKGAPARPVELDDGAR